MRRKLARVGSHSDALLNRVDAPDLFPHQVFEITDALEQFVGAVR
jgi:hypothetical protein